MKNFLKTLLAAFIGTLVALAVCTFFLFAVIGSLAVLAETPAPVVPASSILKIDLSHPITEQSSDDLQIGFASFSARKTIGILPAVEAIRKAAADPSIKFIYLRPSGLNIGLAQLEELRNALSEFRQSGKPVIAYGDNFSQGAYYLASAADKIYLNEEGRADLLGLGTNMMFFKDLLDKLGIQVQLIRHGKFKAAAEQFVSSGISSENREQNQEMLDSVWNTWLESIGTSRGIEPAELNRLVNDLQLGNASDLTAFGLVDSVVTHRQMTEQLCTLFGVSEEKELKMISLPDYIRATRRTDLKSKDKIAVVYADGEITMDGKEGISVAAYLPILRKIQADSTIKGVVLRVNSPGGDAQAAAILNDELQNIRASRPVTVSFGNYAASGGYWISAQSDRIFTDKTTLTGSIGVFSLAMNYGTGLKKHLDINSTSITTNRHSDMFSGLRPLNDKEISYMQGMVEKIYTQFTELVADGRGLEIPYVDSIGQGRVWTGADALRLGLADQEGGLTAALDWTASSAGLANYRLLEYPVQKNFTEKLMEQLNTMNSAVRTVSDPLGSLRNAYSGLAEENNCKVFARLPLIYEFTY